MSNLFSFVGFMNKKGQLRAEPAKVQPLVEWVPPKSKQLQHFLGFAPFYQRLIIGENLDFCEIALLFTHLAPQGCLSLG